MKAFLSLLIILPVLFVGWRYLPFEVRHTSTGFVRRNWLRVLLPIAALCAVVIGLSTTSFKLF